MNKTNQRPRHAKRMQASSPHSSNGRRRRTYSSGATQSSGARKKRSRTSHIKRNTAAKNKKRMPQRRISYKKNTPVVFPKSKNLRIIPIGGCEEVGRNMTVFEYDGDIVILDMGIQFPEEDMPGIDYIIPNAKYLEGREKDIKGVVFSHGHLDHIGAAPILLEKLNNPTIVGRDLTIALLKHRVEDYKKGSSKNLKIIHIKSIKDVLKLGKFTITFFQVEHSIMDAVGVIIETPSGTVVHPGDWTLDRDKKGKPTLDYRPLRKLPKPTILMLESLGVFHEHVSGSYEDMYNNLYEILSRATGRVIIGTFSSQVERVKWVLKAAKDLGKKVALDGYSMKKNVEIAKKLGYIKIDNSVFIDIKNIADYPADNVVIVCTGAQGEENAVLMRIISKRHRFVELHKNDTVIFSSSIIPGNERTIQRLKDNIYRQCDNVYHGEIMDVHISGHATRPDCWEMIEQIQPTYFIPVYANHYFLKEARNLALEKGFDKNKIFVPDNGTVIEFNKTSAQVIPKKVPSGYVFVDGLGISDMQNIVLRDRQVLAEDGMLVVIATVDSKTGKLVQNPDIISRGFVFLKDNKDLIEDIRQKVKHLVIKSDPSTWADTNQIRNDIRDKIGQFVFSKTEKRPMMLPVVIEV